ncbi:MAG: LysM repeat-containing protein [Chloroflexi bacterium]|nr:MAG: LysM repeat-containing protein [Chloroflexota bacterium]
MGLAVYSVPRLADSSSAQPARNDAAVAGIAANADRSSSGADAELVSETDAAVADAGRPVAIEEAAAPGPEGDAPVVAGAAADADIAVTISDAPAVTEESVAPTRADDTPAADTLADDSPDTDALAEEAPGADPAVVAEDSQRPRGMLAEVVATIAGETDIVGVSDAPIPTDDVPLDESDAAPVADEPAVAVAGPDPVDALATWPDIVEYVVQPGDALLRIADAFGTTAVAIIALNDIENGEIIEIGETLSVPVDYAGPDS